MTEQLQDLLRTSSCRVSPVAIALRRATESLPNADYQIAIEEGGLLAFLIAIIKPRLALEIGVFTGYSALVAAMSLSRASTLYACDISDEHRALAELHWEQAGVLHQIKFLHMPGVKALNFLSSTYGAGTFGYVFIDADKPSFIEYYSLAQELIASDGIVVVDNIFRQGRVVDPAVQDPGTVAVRGLLKHVSRDGGPQFSVIPIGDGVLLARKESDK